MARTIEEICNEILAEKANHSELSGLDSTSDTAIYKLWAYITAVCIWTLEKIYDAHKAEINAAIATKKPHGLMWYREKALQFQYGVDLLPNSEVYNNAGLNESQINLLRIVKYAAVTEVDGKLRIKVAKIVANDLTQLAPGELAAFTNYISRIKDAGVRIKPESLPADALQLGLDIWYNPLVLKSDGTRIDGGNSKPVEDAVKAFLKQLPFNGEYSNTRLVDYLQTVDGVVLPVINYALARYGLFPFASIDEKYIPDAGYLRVSPADLTINYREYV